MYADKTTGEDFTDDLQELFSRIKESQENIKALKEEKDILSSRIEQKNETLEGLKAEAKYFLEKSGEKTISTDFGELKIRKSKSLVFDGDVENLPESAVLIKKQPNKKVIKELLLSGVNIEGAKIEQSESVSLSAII